MRLPRKHDNLQAHRTQTVLEGLAAHYRIEFGLQKILVNDANFYGIRVLIPELLRKYTAKSVLHGGVFLAQDVLQGLRYITKVCLCGVVHQCSQRKLCVGYMVRCQDAMLGDRVETACMPRVPTDVA